MFRNWWEEEGRFIDPDTEDVPWFDKRKELCEHAYEAGRKQGMAEGGNYVADQPELPKQVTFANGRIVTARKAADGLIYLTVSKR